MEDSAIAAIGALLTAFMTGLGYLLVKIIKSIRDADISKDKFLFDTFSKKDKVLFENLMNQVNDLWDKCNILQEEAIKVKVENMELKKINQTLELENMELRKINQTLEFKLVEKGNYDSKHTDH